MLTMINCSYCHTEHENVNENPQDLCDSCAEEHTICQECEDLTHQESMILVYQRVRYSYGRRRFEEVYVCESCANQGYTRCYDCGNLHQDEHVNIVMNGNSVCLECREENYSTCSNCNCEVHTDYIYYHEGRGEHFCEECLPPENNKSELIKSYSYKPRTEFYSLEDEMDTGEYYGTELEVDEGSDLGDPVDQLDDILSPEGEFYYKEDGSLSDDSGFEIISHPLTYRYHMEKVDYQAAFKHLKNNGFRSHDAGTCGLHVHISRDAFGDDENKRMYNLSRFMYMFEKFYDEFFTLTRRTQSQMQQWAQRYGLEPEEKPEDMIHKNNEDKSRYYLVNFHNVHTVEVRAFRGTLSVNTYKASLQIVKSFRDIACSGKDLESFTWEDYKKLCKAKGFNELFEYIIEKGL